MRTIGYAICAASAKFGALIVALLFAYIDKSITRLYICAFTSLLGVVFTIIFIPEITTLNIKENDVFWKSLIESTGSYSGQYLKSRYLSFYERNVAYKY